MVIRDRADNFGEEMGEEKIEQGIWACRFEGFDVYCVVKLRSLQKTTLVAWIGKVQRFVTGKHHLHDEGAL